ncbi:MAG TPA: class III signal peptide-containing protein [archaeon]|nr:class III signal peptide-containing protein [archaeon]HPV66079.1 class III signal peptide-containing protein [archaeon]
MKFNKKGQGALEYLLLIGGAVLIAVIVIALLVGMGSSSKKNASQGGDRINQAISGTAIASVLQSANCDGNVLKISYTHNGGDVNLVIDDTIQNITADSTTSSYSGENAGACEVNKQHKIALHTTASSGATAYSNAIYVTRKS